MGLLGNSKTKDLKNKFVDFMNLLANFSYGEMPRNIGLSKINFEYQRFIEIAKGFSNPFCEYFNLYTQNTGMLGEKTSVAEGVVIVFLSKNAVLDGTRLSNSVQINMILQAKAICASSQGQEFVHNILY